jgi:hypothetical protein
LIKCLFFYFSYNRREDFGILTGQLT